MRGAREAALDERQKNIESSEAARSEASLQRREAAVQAREEANKRQAEQLAVMRADLESKVGKMRNLTATLEG